MKYPHEEAPYRERETHGCVGLRPGTYTEGACGEVVGGQERSRAKASRDIWWGHRVRWKALEGPPVGDHICPLGRIGLAAALGPGEKQRSQEPWRDCRQQLHLSLGQARAVTHAGQILPESQRDSHRAGVGGGDQGKEGAEGNRRHLKGSRRAGEEEGTGDRKVTRSRADLGEAEQREGKRRATAGLGPAPGSWALI